jgi:serine/threonine protein kinase
MEKINKVIDKLNIKVASIESVPESFSSEVYKLVLESEEVVFAKIPYNKDKLFREYKILERIEWRLPVPRVIDFWSGDESITGALLLSPISGTPCTGLIDEKIAHEIGTIHAKLHDISMPGYGNDVQEGYRIVENNNWRYQIKNNFEKFKEPCKDIINKNLYVKCINYFDEAFSELPPPDGPCLVHMDFRPGNILINHNEVAGIIDFESSSGGSSEIDFTKVNRYIFKKYPHLKSAYKKGYTSIRPLIELDKILPFYSFYDAFSAVVWCKKRGIDKHKDFLMENLSILEETVM